MIYPMHMRLPNSNFGNPNCPLTNPISKYIFKDFENHNCKGVLASPAALKAELKINEQEKVIENNIVYLM